MRGNPRLHDGGDEPHGRRVRGASLPLKLSTYSHAPGDGTPADAVRRSTRYEGSEMVRQPRNVAAVDDVSWSEAGFRALPSAAKAAGARQPSNLWALPHTHG